MGQARYLTSPSTNVEEPRLGVGKERGIAVGVLKVAVTAVVVGGFVASCTSGVTFTSSDALLADLCEVTAAQGESHPAYAIGRLEALYALGQVPEGLFEAMLVELEDVADLDPWDASVTAFAQMCAG